MRSSAVQRVHCSRTRLCLWGLQSALLFPFNNLLIGCKSSSAISCNKFLPLHCSARELHKELHFNRHQSRTFLDAPPGHIKPLSGDLSLTQLGRGRAGGLALMPCVAGEPLGLSHRVGVTGRVCCRSGPPQQEETERCERHESLIINASRQTQLLLPFAPSGPSHHSERKDGSVCVCVCERRALLK